MELDDLRGSRSAEEPERSGLKRDPLQGLSAAPGVLFSVSQLAQSVFQSLNFMDPIVAERTFPF